MAHAAIAISISLPRVPGCTTHEHKCDCYYDTDRKGNPNRQIPRNEGVNLEGFVETLLHDHEESRISNRRECGNPTSLILGKIGAHGIRIIIHGRNVSAESSSSLEWIASE